MAFRYELLVCHVYLGEMDKAKNEFQMIVEDWPQVNITWMSYNLNLKRKEDLEHWVVAFRKAGVQEFPFSYEGDEKNILSEDEFKSLIMDRKIVGLVPPDKKWWSLYSKNGNFSINGSWKFHGKYWFEGNLLRRTRSTTPDVIEAVMFCRNPEGTNEEKNEYYLFFPQNGEYYPFSVEK